jgi:Flp pilus assembly pilin Flp
MIAPLHRLWVEENGQDIAEYAVMLAVIVLVVGTIRLVGSNANNAFSSAASSIQYGRGGRHSCRASASEKGRLHHCHTTRAGWRNRAFGYPRKKRKSALGVRTIMGSGYSLRRNVASQRPDCASLVPLNIKHSGQSCHLEQVVYSLVQVYEPKLPTLIPEGCVNLNQLAYS